MVIQPVMHFGDLAAYAFHLYPVSMGVSSHREDMAYTHIIEQHQYAIWRMGHGVRAPLNTIVSMAEGLLERSGLCDSSLHLKRAALKAALAQINGILDDASALLQVDGIGSRSVHAVPVERCLKDILCLREYQTLTGRITVRCDPPHLAVMANDSTLMELLRCLLDNAIKHSSAGSDIHVNVYTMNDGSATIRVINECEEKSRSQVVGVRRRLSFGDEVWDAWGLGLSICRHIAESLGGHVTVGNAEPGLFSVKLSLPIASSIPEIRQ